jgi:hypothetical protein
MSAALLAAMHYPSIPNFWLHLISYNPASVAPRLPL